VHLETARRTGHCPTALDRAPATLASLGVRRPYVLAVSHFYHYKNYVELVRGFAHARPRLPKDVTLVIAGGEHEVDYAARVRHTIELEGVQDCVQLLGEVPYKDLPPLYAAASLFVFPSSCENFPNILVEGMASGAPTLASRRFQPVSVATGTLCSGRRRPEVSLPSRST